MSFGSPTPIDLSISGTDFAANRAFAESWRRNLRLPALRDVQFASLDTDDRRHGRPGARPCDVVMEGAAKASSAMASAIHSADVLA
jgi:hypothetical protein